jgi:phosphotransacetylase
VGIGDTITASVTVMTKHEDSGDVALECLCVNQDGKAVITGTAVVRAPREKVRLLQVMQPDIRVARHDRIHGLVTRACLGTAVPTAIVHPVDPVSLRAAVEAGRLGMIAPVLVGPVKRMRAVAEAEGLDLSACRLVDAGDPEDAAAKAVAMARAGEVAMLIKGDLHTDVLMHPALSSQTGLRTPRHVSHVYVVDVPGYPRLLLLTDMAINISPTLTDKVGIVQNAIACAHVIGIPQPRVAILAAVEVVNARLPSTLDAAALCKMADRGQITGALLDGPLAFDNAVDATAAAEKGIISPVAGRADILVVPDLESGNMLAKELIFLAGAEAAGVVLGATVPIVLTSRADGGPTRLASCALGVLMARDQEKSGVIA